MPLSDKQLATNSEMNSRRLPEGRELPHAPAQG